MKRHPKGRPLLALLAGLSVGSCGVLPTGGGGGGSSPPPVRGPDCAAWEGPSVPTLFATSSELRAAVRRQAEQGAVAVRFARSGCDLRIEILEACVVAASYTFELRPGAPTKKRLVQPLEVLDAASIEGMSWVPMLQKYGAIGLERANLGALRLPVPLRLPVDALSSEACRGATHLVAAIELGRFRAVAGSVQEVDRALAGESAPGQSSAKLISSVGSADACAEAARRAQPFIGCDEPLALRLMPLSGAEVRKAEVSPMVLVPAGEFMRGEDGSAKDRGPARKIRLDAFEIDRYEVTAAEYAACITAGSCAPTDAGPFCTAGVLGKERHPVNCIDFPRAEAYCAFAKKRLPTEAEWEKAARGATGRIFEWGNEWPPRKGAGNFADEAAARAFPHWSRIVGYVDGHAATAPVDAFGAEGLAQASGNVSEWVADIYEDDYYAKGPDENPVGARRGSYRLVRGGHFGAALPDELKLTRRDARAPNRASMYFGVRCARTPNAASAEDDLPEGEDPAPRKR